MYENIGGKLKGLAKVICIIGMVLSCISGLLVIVGTADSYMAAEGVLYGLLTAGLGSLISWLSNMAIYGFGHLIEKQEETADAAEEIADILRRNLRNGSFGSIAAPQTPSASFSTATNSQERIPAWKRVEMEAEKAEAAQCFCRHCGETLTKDAVFCPKCGGHR